MTIFCKVNSCKQESYVYGLETTYISAHEENKQRNSREFPNLDIALTVLRQCGIPEYEIRRVTKELGAINGAIVQVPEPIVFAEASEAAN